MLSIQTDNKKTEIKREARTKKEMKRQEEQRKYQIALAKDKCLYDVAEPILYLDWVKEGIIEVTRREFGIKYFEYDGKHKQIIFPIKNYKTGEVVAYQKRMLYNEDYSTSYEAIGLPKYMITEGYDKNDNVYGLWENIDGIRKKKLIVIYESPKSVMKRWTLRDFTGVAIQGHFLSYKQAEIIAQTIGESYERAYWEQESCELTGETPKNIKYENGEVVVAFDKDVPLNDILAACWRLKDTLQSAGFKISYIYDKWYKLDNKESPADANKATFDYLMENRIVYKE